MDQQVLQCLQATLSPEEGTRKGAEAQLEQLFFHPEGGLSLARIVLAQDLPLAQLLLRRYVNDHWSPMSGTYLEPITPLEVKAQIRPIAFHGLSDPQRKLRTACAAVVSTIAISDYPDEWPNLLPDLVGLLQSPSSDSVHGAMQVVDEFAKNILAEDQIVPVIKEFLPVLLTILQDPSRHSATTRTLAVKVYVEVLKTLETVRDEHPQAVREALGIIGQPWVECFKMLLGTDLGEQLRGSWESLPLYTEIFGALTFLWNKFPKILSAHLVELLQISIHALAHFQPTFFNFHISSDIDIALPSSPSSDSGNDVDLELFPTYILEFLDAALRKQKADEYLKSAQGSGSMETLIGYAIDYAQVSSEDEETWLAEPNVFVEDVDDDEAGEYGLRVSCQDLLGLLIEKYPKPLSGLLDKISRQRIEQSVSLHSQGQKDWWKPAQAALTIVGGLADDIRELQEGSFDLTYLFTEVVPGLLNRSDAPFLQGRAFILASQFASSLPPDMTAQYLSAAVQAMESDNFAVKLSAVKTIKNFCRFLSAETLVPYTGKILHVLVSLLEPTSEETLYLVLETLRAVMGLTKASADEATVLALVDAVYTKWLTCSEDPIVFAIIEELFEDLATLSFISSIVRHLGPRLASVISQATTEDTLHLPVEGIQLASAFLARSGPIEPEYVATMTAAILGRLQVTDDNDVVQHGVIHLTLVVRKDADKLVSWHDANGNNGISSVFALLGRFLEPSFSESGGIFVGELIMHLFRKASSSIGPVLPDLLRALSERLASAKMPSFIQSLVMPFAYLLGTDHTEETIALLSFFSVPTEDGTKNGLDVVLGAWCDVCEIISGSWNIRVSALGMSKLFVMPDERLQRVMVKGDLIITEQTANTIMTRSRTKGVGHQYTSIQFPLKALKLILKDVQIVGPKGKGEVIANIDEDDGDDDWDDDDPLGGAEPQKDEFEFLSSWLDEGHRDDAQDDDEDLKSDPLALLDMGEHLTSVLRRSYSTNSNGMHEMIEGLNEIEKGILRGTLTV